MLRSFAASATCKGLQVLVCTDPGLPTRVLGDADRIRQVLANLLSNAIKFTEHGRVVLRVRQVQREGDSSVLAWQVTDTGVGIPLRSRHACSNRSGRCAVRPARRAPGWACPSATAWCA